MHFDVSALAPGYATPRTPLGDCVQPWTVRPGWLRLTGQESMNSLHHVTLVARRQQEHEMQAETRMDFAPSARSRWPVLLTVMTA